MRKENKEKPVRHVYQRAYDDKVNGLMFVEETVINFPESKKERVIQEITSPMIHFNLFNLLPTYDHIDREHMKPWMIGNNDIISLEVFDNQDHSYILNKNGVVFMHSLNEKGEVMNTVLGNFDKITSSDENICVGKRFAFSYIPQLQETPKLLQFVADTVERQFYITKETYALEDQDNGLIKQMCW